MYASAAIFTSAAVQSFAADVSFRRDCVAAGGIVRLADVAEIRGAANEVEALGGLSLIPAPAAGEVRELRSREVQELLTLHGIDARSVHFTGASITKVRSGEGGGSIENSKPNAGVVKASAQKPVVGPVNVSAKERLVATAAATLKRGDIVRREDIVLAAATSDQGAGAGITQIENVVGHELTKAVKEGDTFDAASLRLPLLVKRGELVNVLVRGDGISVRSTAQALEEGGHGELVTVQSLLSRKDQYVARVIDFQTVEVMPQASTVPAPIKKR